MKTKDKNKEIISDFIDINGIAFWKKPDFVFSVVYCIKFSTEAFIL